MRSRLLLGTLIVLVFTAGMVTAATTTIPLGGDEPQLALMHESRGTLRFQVDVGELTCLDVTTREGDFTRLFIPGFHSSQDVGDPELPLMNRLIAIPYGATARVEVSQVQSRLIDLAEFGVANPVFPAQPSLSKSQDPADVPFVYNGAAYRQAEYGRELAQVVVQGRLRAMDLGRLEISPVSYLPGTNQIRVVESIEVTVSFDGADYSAGNELKAATYSPFFEHLYTRAANSREFQDDYPDRVGDVVTMVVVVPPEFEAQMQSFVQWKTERGFHMIVGVLGSPEVGTTTSSIRTYLHGLYNDATPELPAPSFVLFVGDIAQMPTFFESGNATDRPYCAVDGDLVPDMFYGRFSATNPSQLQAILDKSLMYDKYEMPDPSYLEEVVMIAGMDSSHGSTWGNGQINYGTTYYFNAAHNIYSHTYLYPESGSQSSAIIQNVSDGVSYINYTAHGSATSWADPSFTQANINSLQNDGEYCLAVGNCCSTSEYDYGECFAETWLRAANKGAIGYIGGSNSTYWDEDYWWGVGLATVTANPTYENSGLGAYDGLFHDHGEAEHLWYVTNDALIFSGNLAVMEAGSSLTTYYWNIYNLMGDPSISTWVGTPQTNNVIHDDTVFVGNPSMTIQAEHGSYVGLTQDGVLMGCGTVGETGSLEVEFLQQLTPGVPMKLVVMAQFRVPYVTELNVIVPATVLITPSFIQANVETEITVTVLDADGIDPQPGIEVWAEGLEYATTPVTTDASGEAVFTVNYPYGPTLDICGQDPQETYRLFTEPITCRALRLTAPDLTVTTDIGMFDMFALNLPGTLHATVNQPGHILYAQLPDGTLASTTDFELTVTPSELGQVTGIIAVSGYELYTESFDVIEAYGTLSGYVHTGGTAIPDATVYGYDAQSDLVFTVVSDAQGDFVVPEELVVAEYTLVVDHFGYLHYEDTVFVNYGANDIEIDLTPAPASYLFGTVTEVDTGDPLEATVKLYRSDNNELIDETVCDESGQYQTGAVPYFDYVVKVRAWHHVPATLTMTLDEPAVEKDFELAPTAGDLLLIDDDAQAAFCEAKLDEKTGQVIGEAYQQDDTKSSALLATDLEEVGYYVTTVDAASVDPSTFVDYDLVILACGDNITTLSNAALKAGLVTFAQEGGHILLEGGELGYDQYGDSAFATHVMHSNDWNGDSVGDITIPQSGHAIQNYPNVMCSQISITYDGYGDSDAMAPLPDAEAVCFWTGNPTDASVIAYDTNPAPEGGQIAFFCFDYAAAGPERINLLENAVTWLMTPEFGNCGVSGTVTLDGETDHSGVLVQAIPNGGSVVTGTDGSYVLDGLFAGPYTIRATKLGWSIGEQEVSLSDGQQLTDLDFLLTVVYEALLCSQPGLSIPDDNPAGVTDTADMTMAGTIEEVDVYVDISHTYIGDLIVRLTSPAGTTVVLHDMTGGGTDNLIGWYPDELTPEGDLSAFVGEEMLGEWTLFVSDNLGADYGTVNEWCVRVTYDSPTGVDPTEQVPQKFALRHNYPNPFNPVTNIAFDLPRATHVALHVYDVAGRLVRTLVDDDLAASSHTVVWNGTDSSGRQMASGIYYYQLVTDEVSFTRKMTLLK